MNFVLLQGWPFLLALWATCLNLCVAEGHETHTSGTRREGDLQESFRGRKHLLLPRALPSRPRTWWCAVAALLSFPVTPPSMAILAASATRALARSTECSSHTTSLHSPFATFCPGLAPGQVPHFSCLPASSHHYSTRKKKKNNLEKGKSVLILLTMAVMLSLLVHPICLSLIVCRLGDLGSNPVFMMRLSQFLNKLIKKSAYPCIFQNLRGDHIHLTDHCTALQDSVLRSWQKPLNSLGILTQKLWGTIPVMAFKMNLFHSQVMFKPPPTS